ncbi:hypothetical protein N9E24_00085 [Alphaproteobacteria bacterium]|nr:hypothetical protein [Alphaproteobacteria bacterium]
MELNELNFDYVEKYIKTGSLRNFSRLISGSYFRSTSEKDYNKLEPWIQWPTFYTGLSYKEHNVFRLGDIEGKGFSQIWEEVEALSDNNSVLAISPMNADNRVISPRSVFLPDPWSNIQVKTNNKKISKVYEWARHAVQNNAADGMSHKRLLLIAPSLISMFDLKSTVKLLPQLFRIFLKGEKFRKALVLDLILYQLFKKQSQAERYVYKSLFLNAAAHLQHHYAFNSSAYEGSSKNPSWYTEKSLAGSDPLLEIYKLYDWMLGELFESDEVFFVTTGLSQRPNPTPFHQYKLSNASLLLAIIGVKDNCVNIRFRMSRDFEIVATRGSETLNEVSKKLSAFKVNEKDLFLIDRRNESLFVQVCYRDAPKHLTAGLYGNQGIDVTPLLTHVSIENQIHIGEGYVADPYKIMSNERNRRIPLKNLKAKIVNYMTQSVTNV